MKILHTADVHIGARFKGLGTKGKEQRKQLKETFKKVIDTAISEKVDVVLISGDLFDSNIQGQSEIDFVIDQFKRLESKNISVCLIGGTHDYLSSNSILKKCKFEEILKNTYLLDQKMPFVTFDDLNLTVYGISLTSNKSPNSPLKNFPKDNRSKFNIGMIHGSFDTGQVDKDDWVFSSGEIEATGLDYLACGHWHSYFEIPAKNVKALYPGSPEMIAVDQKDSGYVLLIEIGNEVKVERIRIGKRKVGSLKLDVGKLNSLDGEISKLANPDLILDVEITGLRDVEDRINIEKLLEDLGDKFFRLRIIDSSHVKADIDEAKYPENLTIGKYVRILKEKISSSGSEDEKSIAEEALQLGIALLSGKEVLK